jgi:ABC-type amino acid transport substrate-binding protein
VTNAWEGLLVGLVTGRFDAVVSSVSITKKRAKNVLFTERYYQTPIHFIALKGSDIAIDEAGLKGKIIGVQSSTTGSQYMRDKYSNIANIKQYPDSITMKIDALAGRVDVFVIDAVAGWSWMNSDEGKNFQFVGSPVNVDEGIAIALNKNNDKLRDIFNTALETIMENGEYDRINSKYFNYSIY